MAVGACCSNKRQKIPFESYFHDTGSLVVVGAVFAIFLPSLKQLACAVEYHPKYSHFMLTYREVARNSVAKLPSWWCGLGAGARVKKVFWEYTICFF